MFKIDKDINYTNLEKSILIEALMLSIIDNHNLANQVILHQRTQIGIDRAKKKKVSVLYEEGEE